jgi:predicted dehydrogenase
MMAWDVAGCERMRQTALKNRKVLEIGYQRNYNPMYQAAHDGIIKTGLLGDVYLSRILWHRNGNWRRQGEPPSKDYNPSKWGYPTFEHLWNWRLYKRYSRGLIAELASHEMNIVNWFFGAEPTSVMGTGGIYRFDDGREVPDHVYATWEYDGGRTAVFSSIESNATRERIRRLTSRCACRRPIVSPFLVGAMCRTATVSLNRLRCGRPKSRSTQYAPNPAQSEIGSSTKSRPASPNC